MFRDFLTLINPGVLYIDSLIAQSLFFQLNGKKCNDM
jgi:hypothetical protein